MGDLARRLSVPTALAVVTLALAQGGAGSPSATVKVAFLQGEQVVYVDRSGSTLRQAVAALLAGPTTAERKREIASAAPPGRRSAPSRSRTGSRPSTSASGSPPGRRPRASPRA